LAARYNSSKAKYDLYPDLEPFKIGHGYFVRLDAAQPTFSVPGRVYQNVEGSVALKPGWNLISSPLMESVATSRVRVVKTADSPVAWADASGVDLDANFYEFTPGPPDAATGAPETGTFAPASSFEPGKAYFVRVLASEGVTLTFQPQDFTGSMPQTVAAIPPPSGWRLGLTLRYGRTSLKASATVGQSATATRAYDPREDSGMPPGIGGFQLIVEDYEPMYRDIRPIGGEVYTLHLQGLTPGRTYMLDFKTLLGTVPPLSLRDSNGRSLGTIRPGSSFSYYARTRDAYIQLTAAGGTR
jgi:hypothetical protein